jgi:hypothetical protein
MSNNSFSSQLRSDTGAELSPQLRFGDCRFAACAICVDIVPEPFDTPQDKLREWDIVPERSEWDIVPERSEWDIVPERSEWDAVHFG